MTVMEENPRTTEEFLLQELFRGLVRSIRIEGLQEPLSVLEGMRCDRVSLLRKSPALLEALDVVLSELRPGAPKSGAKRRSQPLTIPIPREGKRKRLRQSLEGLLPLQVPRDPPSPMNTEADNTIHLRLLATNVAEGANFMSNTKTGQYRS